MPKQPTRPVPKLSADELMFALTSGTAVYDGRMQTAPLSELTRPVEVGDETVTLTDVPLNRAAIAVLESLKHDPEKAQAALCRIMLIAFDVFNHPDAEKWKRITVDGRWEVSEALIEAIATVPASYYRKVPAARVFKLAEKIAKAGQK